MSLDDPDAIIRLKDISVLRYVLNELSSPLLIKLVPDTANIHVKLGLPSAKIFIDRLNNPIFNPNTPYGEFAYGDGFYGGGTGVSKVYGVLSVPIGFNKFVIGRKKTYGRISLPIINTIITIPSSNAYGDNIYGDDVYGNSAYSNPGGPYGESFYGSGVYSIIGDSAANYEGSTSLPITFGASTSGIKSPMKTSVAEISLFPHEEPVTRTRHSIRVRARTLSGSTGVIKAALYEGTTKVSGVTDLVSDPLTNILNDYVLDIPDSSVATITDYSNLSIRFWGHDSSISGLVFEVAEIYLELPVGAGASGFGSSTSLSVAFGSTISGNRISKTTPISEISLASHGIPSSRTNHSIKLRARTTSGSTGVIKAALYEGSTRRSGVADLVTTPLTNVLSDYTLSIPNIDAASITNYSNLSIRFWGYTASGASLIFEISKMYLELPAAINSGVVSLSIGFGSTVAGIKLSKATPIAEISLTPHSNSPSSTDHSIKLRARTTTGSTGVIKAALYEGSIRRSGITDLVTSPLTNSLGDYTLPISSVDAATITDYSNLSIRFFGYNPSGLGLIFEISEIYLEIPS